MRTDVFFYLVETKSTAKTGKSNELFDLDSDVCDTFYDLEILIIDIQKLSLLLLNPRFVQVQL